jgi:hypothetical protein
VSSLVFILRLENFASGTDKHFYTRKQNHLPNSHISPTSDKFPLYRLSG